jgi:hypothetical protein
MLNQSRPDWVTNRRMFTLVCFYENYRSSPHFKLIFHGEDYALIFTKMGRTSVWTIFSQTHLVSDHSIQRNCRIFLMRTLL